jgi:hypothetical protein
MSWTVVQRGVLPREGTGFTLVRSTAEIYCGNRIRKITYLQGYLILAVLCLSAIPPNHRLTDTPAEALEASVFRGADDVFGQAAKKMG